MNLRKVLKDAILSNAVCILWLGQIILVIQVWWK
jgi:hypothetical protein